MSSLAKGSWEQAHMSETRTAPHRVSDLAEGRLTAVADHNDRKREEAPPGQRVLHVTDQPNARRQDHGNNPLGRKSLVYKRMLMRVHPLTCDSRREHSP